ncbi:MAG: TetR/AcrR family transcriptional regulator [Chloroflexi bacterium]|nr:TetR/AcrR family transcriptional regulator [Chloroflexota bacterium]
MPRRTSQSPAAHSPAAKPRGQTRRAPVLQKTLERRSQILSAASKVFAKKGFERATIAEIAREAGVAEGSIYNYFKNKSDLLVSIPRQFIQPAIQSLGLDAIASGRAKPGGEAASGATDIGALRADPTLMLTQVARNIIAATTQNAEVLRVLMSSLPVMNRATQAKYLEQVPLYALGMLETYFRMQVEAGIFRGDLNPAMAARAFPGLLFPFLLIQEILPATAGERFDYEQVIAHVVQVFLHGTLAEDRTRKVV